MFKFLNIWLSGDKKHKYVVELKNLETNRTFIIRFGKYGMMDYLLWNEKYPNNPEIADRKRKAYIARHSGMNENWSDISTAGAWSRNLLWEKRTFEEALNDIKRKFNL